MQGISWDRFSDGPFGEYKEVESSLPPLIPLPTVGEVERVSRRIDQELIQGFARWVRRFLDEEVDEQTMRALLGFNEYQILNFSDVYSENKRRELEHARDRFVSVLLSYQRLSDQDKFRIERLMATLKKEYAEALINRYPLSKEGNDCIWPKSIEELNDLLFKR